MAELFIVISFCVCLLVYIGENTTKSTALLLDPYYMKHGVYQGWYNHTDKNKQDAIKKTKVIKDINDYFEKMGIKTDVNLNDQDYKSLKELKFECKKAYHKGLKRIN